MAIANYYEQKPLIIFTFTKICNGEQRLAAQHYPVLAVPYAPMAPITSVTRTPTKRKVYNQNTFYAQS